MINLLMKMWRIFFVPPMSAFVDMDSKEFEP